MKDLDTLIAEREVLRTNHAELTKEIQAQKSRLAEAKKTNLFSGGVRHEEYLKVTKENKRLRGLIGLLDRASGSTYQEVGKMLGVGTHRAKEIVYQEIDLLKFYPPKD